MKTFDTFGTSERGKRARRIFDGFREAVAPGMSRELADALAWMAATPGAKELASEMAGGDKAEVSPDEVLTIIRRVRIILERGR